MIHHYTKFLLPLWVGSLALGAQVYEVNSSIIAAIPKIEDAQSPDQQEKHTAKKPVSEIQTKLTEREYHMSYHPLIINGNPQDAVATLTGNQSSGGYGAAVSGAGDINNDGFDDVIVGAPYYDITQSNEGAVFIYYGSQNGIDTMSPIVLQIGQKDANFGTSVSHAGDLNSDGFGDVVVGAPFFDDEEEDEGAAFIFLGGPSGINAVPQARVEGNMAFANMGYAVASAGNVNNDLYQDLIVAAPGWQNGESNEGAAFIFYGSSQGLDQAIQTTLEGNAEFAMTWSVSGAGDVDNDGYDDVVVGLMGYSNGETFEGAANVYYGSSSGININEKTTLEANQQFSAMGVSVAGPGDLNGDGFDDIIVGASEYTNGQAAEGVVFVFNGSSTGISSVASALLEKDQANADFGHSVCGLGDVNGDGYDDIAVGAYHFAHGQNNEGASFIFLGSPQGPTANSFIYESDQAGAQMGISVRGAGDVNGDGVADLIIGAQTFGTNAEGAAFVFHTQDAALPVRLVDFEARIVESAVALRWSTAMEENSDRFEIQRSDRTRQWESIGEVSANEASNTVQNYKFIDPRPFQGENLYRLKMIDKDRSFAFSSIRSVLTKIPDSDLLLVYPNPASKTIRVKSASPPMLSFFSVDGKQVFQIDARSANGDIDISFLLPGLYTVQAKFPDGTTATDKILIR